MNHDPGLARIRRAVEELALPIVVEADGETIVLSGVVDSFRTRTTVEQIAARLEPTRPIENQLEVALAFPGAETAPYTGSTPTPIEGDWPEPAPRLGEVAELEPDFTRQRLETSPPDLLEEEDTAFFAPTDPVVRPGKGGDLEMLSGFAPTSMDGVDVEPSSMDDLPGDAALEDAIQQELRDDAATTDLVIDVRVRRGLARLRGVVPGPEDAANAEDVASRVSGVVEVIDALDIAGLSTPQS